MEEPQRWVLSLAVSPLPALLTGVATKVVDMDMDMDKDRDMVLDMAGKEREDHRTGEDGRNRAHPLSALTWEILSTGSFRTLFDSFSIDLILQIFTQRT